ncbi:PD-(D/E)XK nuclease family protein [Lactobacillus sp. ESL0684]|uniref:PD-(D/E)XK nuclease family protein n=1 Tax=Lactobacillus sp. ESL0684 TaxID=2983213 RepID=UPI0023F8CE40|nr:PD-(D/E)XK nuclease family protein [Lactobacillus sp. ESL0684]WEV44468.1 PD-(D/E)XK nuclease family protein [Lactobacillus sp. ESL0684]
MIKMLVGRQTDALQEKILQLAVENYQRQPEHETFIIVPNHIKFTTEVNAINKLAVSQNQTEQSVKNLQVLSFSRLAWYFLKDHAIPTQLDDAAAAMLIAKIIEQNRSQLHLFKNVSVNSGLVKQLYNTILQVQSGNLDLDEIENDDLDLETKNKIADLKIIYDAFNLEIADKFATKNELQLQLNEFLAQKKDLAQTDFYFTDFSHFSLQECLTIKLLLMHAGSVTLAFKTKVGELNSQAEPGNYDYVIQKTISQLTHFMQERQLDYQVEKTPIAPKQSERELLNAYWTQSITKPETLKQVQLVRADSRYAEAYFVAHTIYQQVALSNYRYRDFLVLAPNLQEYETYLTPILRQNEIPFFNDLQQEMKYHPLVVLIENIAQLLTKPLQTQNLLAIMKTRLLIPETYQTEEEYVHDVDELENFVLAHGINHGLWKRDFTEYVKAEVTTLDKNPSEVAKLEQLKQYFVKQISTLLADLQKQTDSQKAITIFFNFLTQNGVAKRLEKWRADAQEQGDLQQAAQPEQVWDLLIKLLQDYLLINPDNFVTESFFYVLTNGFKEATFSQIPSTLDAVNLSEMGMIQTSGYKQVFIIGATSNNLPAIQNNPGFLNKENLAKLSGAFSEDAYIEDQQQLNNLDQDYQFGISLALAQDRVYLSYPVINAANEELTPSVYYERLENVAPAEFKQHSLPQSKQDLAAFITNPQASLGYLTYFKQEHATDADAAALIDLTALYQPQRTEMVLTASQFDNQPTDIGPELATKLYGTDLNASVSQLETFYENSYEYFLNYGLHLHKRFENEFDVIQAGNYFHETFDRLVKELERQKLDLADIGELELQQLLELVRTKIKNEAKYQQLAHDPFNQYLFKCLDRTTSNVATGWRKALQKTPLRANYSELSFGLGERVTGLSFNVPNVVGQHQVNLRGKMDRVDLAPLADKNAFLAQVIDYKSSAKKFDLGLFYQGISLQMISYLDVLAQNQDFFVGDKPLSLLGAFYQTVTRKVDRLNSDNLITPSLELKQDKLVGKENLKYTGIINNDPELLLQAEPLLSQTGNSSDLYKGIAANKNGSFRLPKDTAFSREEIELLLKYDEELIKAAASQILTGKIKLNPYQVGENNNALTYSDYREIFFFDKMLGNQYHQIDRLDKKTLLAKIREELGESD